MTRAVLERRVHPDPLNTWFARAAPGQYTRRRLFSTLFDLLQVVTRQQPSVHAPSQGAREAIPVTLRAVYDKLNGRVPEISAALVGDSGEQAGRVIGALGGRDASITSPEPAGSALAGQGVGGVRGGAGTW
jgi:hypothetical protein